MITLTQLEYIVAVGRHRNFRKAAKACFITQPTLSMQVQKLEEDLGVLIFDRSVQPVRPTALGAEILEQAAVVLSQAARIEALASEAQETLEGELRVGVIPTMAPYLVPLFLEGFCETHPKVRIKLSERTTDAIVEALRTGEVEVGLLATPLEEKLIEEHPLFVEPFYVYCAKESALAELDAVAESDLRKERVLVLTEEHCLRTQVVQVCELKDGGRKRAGGFEFEGGSLETLCRLVDQGLGYTVIPHLARNSSTTRRGRVVPFRAPRPSREVSLVVHASFAKRGMLEALAKQIRATLPPELRRSTGDTKTIEPR